MKSTITRKTTVQRTTRFVQTRDKFSIENDGQSSVTWDVDVELPDEWNVGMIVGPSGAGKTTLARQLAGQNDAILITPRDEQGNPVDPFTWPNDRCVIDGFPGELPVNKIIELLSSVGFSSPPSWLQPFYSLSIGEQFRATVARVMAASIITGKTAIIDEFANNVDVKAAQIGSAAISKAVRREKLKLIAVTCREDVAEYMQPDWIIPIAKGDPIRLARGLLHRPKITMEVIRADKSAWELFRHHHYLDHRLHRSARVFVAMVDGEPAALTAALQFPHPKKPGFREHRTVCLPTFQGVGIGNKLSEFVGSLYRATGKPYYSTTSHPAMMRYRARSKLWRMIRAPRMQGGHSGKKATAMAATAANERITAGFEYVGPANADLARAFGVLNDG